MYKVSFYLFLLLGLLVRFELGSVSVEQPSDLSLFGVNLQLIPSALGESKLETKRQAIRNGNLYASNVRLSLQTKAITGPNRRTVKLMDKKVLYNIRFDRCFNSKTLFLW